MGGNVELLSNINDQKIFESSLSIVLYTFCLKGTAFSTKSFFVSGGFAEVNPEKCIVLAESVDEINTLEKSAIEKEAQELEGQETDIAKEQLVIAKAKIDALNSGFYEKI